MSGDAGLENSLANCDRLNSSIDWELENSTVGARFSTLLHYIALSACFLFKFWKTEKRNKSNLSLVFLFFFFFVFFFLYENILFYFIFVFLERFASAHLTSD